MILNIDKHDFSIVWEGTYYKALSNYPEITEWELKSILDFVAYEKDHKRSVTLQIKDEKLKMTIEATLSNPQALMGITPPEKIKECTACKEGGCMTDYFCHTTSLENAIKILKSKILLSAQRARDISLEVLSNESRNAAKDPADYFKYIMFSWGNCQAGDRLVMERELKRMPNEDDLSSHFTPGIRFYFKSDALRNHPNMKSDGYHALKIQDELAFEKYLHALVVPKAYKETIQPLLNLDLSSKVHYLENDCSDIWAWTSKVYHYVKSL